MTQTVNWAQQVVRELATFTVSGWPAARRSESSEERPANATSSAMAVWERIAGHDSILSHQQVLERLESRALPNRHSNTRTA